MHTAVTAEREAILQTLRDFCDAEIRPHVMRWDEAQEFPREVSNCFFQASNPQWMRRAFRIRTRSDTDVIIAFQTLTPVDQSLIDKIIRCANVLS